MMLAKINDCTGCGACENICASKAINMKNDVAGYPHPVVNQAKCIDCGACEQICPVLNCPDGDDYSECYAAWADDQTRSISSSGGIFSVLAETIFENKGIVAGAELIKDKNQFFVEHSIISDVNQIYRLRGSKYIQSRTKQIYQSVKNELEKGKIVLFSGTPCQIAAIKKYTDKKYDRLYTVEVLCKGFLSETMLNDYIEESLQLDHLQTIEFRNKERGWRSDQFTAITDAGKQHKTYPDSAFEHAYHSNSALRHSCYHCQFSGKKRQADISLGDFWGIEWFDQSWNDQKGTSLVLCNTKKGKELLDLSKRKIQRIQAVPIHFAEINRLHEDLEGEERRERFDSIRKEYGFSKASHIVSSEKYDIGLVGPWSVENYGSNLSYFALYSLLTSWGYSVLMIERPESSAWKPNNKPKLFISNPYPQYALSRFFRNKFEMTELNEKCDQFIVGSDQLFFHELYRSFDDYASLSFIFDNKKKIAMAASVGRDGFEGSDYQRDKLSIELGRFHAVSVREKSAIDLFKNTFGISAEWVLDPVFLCEKSAYIQLIKKVEPLLNREYIAAYILDPSEAKKKIILSIAQQKQMPIVLLTDAAMDWVDTNDSIINVSVKNNETWLRVIYDSAFVITDSFHGTCFSIIFEKQFLSLLNRGRGESRFYSLLDEIKCSKQLIIAEELHKCLDVAIPIIDYCAVNQTMEKLVEVSKDWLKRSLDDSYSKRISDTDIIRKDISQLDKEIHQNTDRSLNSEKWLENVDKDLRTTQESVVATQAWLGNVDKDLRTTQESVAAIQAWLGKVDQDLRTTQDEITAIQQNMYNLSHDMNSISLSAEKNQQDISTTQQWLNNTHERVNSLEQRFLAYEERINQLEQVNKTKLKLYRKKKQLTSRK
ncbi:MAG: Coenzyme F420 hydrogenase/dehydrogenase, beta subunit C-terminal domain [Clostridia bacterium]|nr:Coenzyme F420 hydrogenase/dehydrogenase, beta subunit C-terminal domain [Clostridia bacterium]